MAQAAIPILTAVLLKTSIDDSKKAREEQKKALADQEARQNQLQNDAKSKEDAAVAQAFQQTSSKKKPATGASLPGAVAASAVGAPPSNPTAGAKRLIGE